MNDDAIMAGGGMQPDGAVTPQATRGSGGVVAMLDRPEVFRDWITPDTADSEFVADFRSDSFRRLMEQYDLLVDVRRYANERARRAHLARFDWPVMFSELHLTAIRQGTPHYLGLAALRVVTNAGVGFIVDAFQNLTELENMKYHGTGSGSTAEAAGDTGLAAEYTTETNPDSTRATGTTEEGATANIFKTVATNTYDATVAVVEHGIFSQAATGGGVLLDRSVFSAVNLVSGDSLQTDYRLTLSAGG